MEQTVDEKVKALIREQLSDRGELTDSTHLKNDLGADSLDSVELILLLEDTFNIQISAEEDDTVFKNGDMTVGDLIAFVKSKL